MVRLNLHITFLAIVLVVSPLVHAQAEWQVLRNVEYKFRLSYPRTWTIVTADTPNSKAAVMSPRTGSVGTCSVGITPTSQTANRTQRALNEQIASVTMAPSDWLRKFEDTFPDVQVYEAKKVKLQNQPAYSVGTEMSYENLGKKTYMRQILITTLTPGFVWNFTCGTSALSVQGARESFAHWEPTFDEILRSIFIER